MPRNSAWTNKGSFSDDFNSKISDLIKSFQEQEEKNSVSERKKYEDFRSDAYRKEITDAYNLMMNRTPELKLQESKNKGEIDKQNIAETGSTNRANIFAGTEKYKTDSQSGWEKDKTKSTADADKYGHEATMVGTIASQRDTQSAREGLNLLRSGGKLPPTDKHETPEGISVVDPKKKKKVEQDNAGTSFMDIDTAMTEQVNKEQKAMGMGWGRRKLNRIGMAIPRVIGQTVGAISQWKGWED